MSPDVVDRVIAALSADLASGEWDSRYSRLRKATSGLARMSPDVIDCVIAALSADLASGEWDRRHGRLRDLEELDVGLRLIVALPKA